MKRTAAIIALLCLILTAFFGCAEGTGSDAMLRCTILIECKNAVACNELAADQKVLLPSDGMILTKTEIAFTDGESVYDVLVRECRERGIHMEASYAPVYDSAYIEGIANLYEFDCGSLSGWTYCVNGVFPNYGCSNFKLSDGDEIEFHYSCDLGRDVGAVFEE